MRTWKLNVLYRSDGEIGTGVQTATYQQTLKRERVLSVNGIGRIPTDASSLYSLFLLAGHSGCYAGVNVTNVLVLSSLELSRL